MEGTDGPIVPQPKEKSARAPRQKCPLPSYFILTAAGFLRSQPPASFFRASLSLSLSLSVLCLSSTSLSLSLPDSVPLIPSQLV